MKRRCCYGCQERSSTCHGVCEKYLAERKAAEEEYKRIHQDVAKQAALDNYFKNQKIRNRKR